MTTHGDDYRAIKETAIAALRAQGPRPDYNTDGQQVLWDNYRKSLWAEIKHCDEQLAAEEAVEIITQGLT